MRETPHRFSSWATTNRCHKTNWRNVHSVTAEWLQNHPASFVFHLTMKLKMMLDSEALSWLYVCLKVEKVVPHLLTVGPPLLLWTYMYCFRTTSERHFTVCQWSRPCGQYIIWRHSIRLSFPQSAAEGRNNILSSLKSSHIPHFQFLTTKRLWLDGKTGYGCNSHKV